MPEDSETLQDLENWYFEEVYLQQERAKPFQKRLSTLIKIFISLPLASLAIETVILLIPLLIWLVSYRDKYGLDELSGLMHQWLLIFYIASVYAVIGWFIYLLAWDRLRAFDDLREKEKIFQIDDAKGGEIRAIVSELAGKMKIDPHRIVLWGKFSRDRYPSIEEDGDGVIHLLLPLNFIYFTASNSNDARAILAHELGHILQKDTQLYQQTDAYFEIIRNIFLPLQIINVVIQVALVFRPSTFALISRYDWASLVIFLFFVWDAVVIWFLYDGFNKFREARRYSENLADAAAILFADGEALLKVLENLTVVSVKGRKKLTATHPDNEQRVENLRELLHYKTPTHA